MRKAFRLFLFREKLPEAPNVLVEILKKRLNLGGSLYTMLQILSVALFKKMAIYQALTRLDYGLKSDIQCNQLTLFAF